MAQAVQERHQGRGGIAIMLACVLWAIDYVALRGSLYAYQPIQIVVIEHVVGALLMSIVLCGVSIVQPKRRIWQGISAVRYGGWRTGVSLLVIGLCGGVLATMALTQALFLLQYQQYTIPGVMQKLQPIIAIIGAWIVLGERMRGSFWLWTGLALVGSWLVTFGFALPSTTIDATIRHASLLSLGAAAGWGIQTVCARYASRTMPFFAIARWRFVITAVCGGIIFALMSGERSSLVSLWQAEWRTFCLIGANTGLLATFVYYWGMMRTPASYATLYELALPISLELVALRSLLWGGEGTLLSPGQRTGVALITGAIILIRRSSNAIIRKKQ